MEDPLSDSIRLISAAASGKLRLVRLLVEGGAQVNGRNPEGETALLAACKALRGEPAGPETVKLLTYLLKNKADPNAQDQAGRTALMYACMERAGEQVASTLLAAGADPSMEDQFGASALVYAINAQHQPTLKVLMDSCLARGCDIIIIATETDVNGGPVTRRYLNVPPSPDTSPVSCMSPSDIVLKTGSPNSPEGENIFNFRGPGKQGGSSSSRRRAPSCEPSPLSQSSPPASRHRVLSEPWLAIHNQACPNQAHEEEMRMDGDQVEHEDSYFHQVWIKKREHWDNRYSRESYNSWSHNFSLRGSQSLLSLAEMTPAQEIPRGLPPEGGGATLDTYTSSGDKLPSCSVRRNTLPSVMVVPPLLHLPPLVNQSDSHLQVPPSKSRSLLYLPRLPSSSSSRASGRPGFLPPLQLSSSVASLVAPPVSCSNGERSRLSLRRHSVQFEQIRGGGGIV